MSKLIPIASVKKPGVSNNTPAIKISAPLTKLLVIFCPIIIEFCTFLIALRHCDYTRRVQIIAVKKTARSSGRPTATHHIERNMVTMMNAELMSL